MIAPAEGTDGIRSAVRRLEVVVELASLVNSSYDLGEIVSAAIPKLQRVLEFRRASVTLVSDDRSEYYLHTLYDAARNGFVRVDRRFPVESGLTGRAIKTGCPIRTEGFSGTGDIRIEGEASISVIVVPLHMNGEIIGTLNFGSGTSASYDDADLDLATLLARQIELSIQYSNLLATIHRQREELAEKHAAVESERTRLKALIDSSDAAILLASDGVAAYVNQEMAKLLGRPPDRLVGTPITTIHHALGRRLVDSLAIEAQVVALQNPHGRLRDRVEFGPAARSIYDRTVTPVRGADGDLLGHLIVLRDVTREATLDLAKDEFVSIVSHEMRTPLTSMKTSLHLLRGGVCGSINAESVELVDVALRNLERLVRLVDDLLDLSRMRSGQVVPKVVPVCLTDVVSRAATAVEGLALERDVAIALTSNGQRAIVLGEADRLEQVVVNLLSNAIRHTPPSGKVKLRCSSDETHAVLEVADEGPGIPSSQLDRVFEKFTQLAAPTTRTHGGAGLGLAITKSIVESFGGKVWAESVEGEGASFFVRLPLTEAAPM